MHRAPNSRSVTDPPRRYAIRTGAAVAIEGALSITLLVAAFAAIMDIVQSVQLTNRVERVAWAIARSNAMEPAPAATADDLRARIETVIEAEVGGSFDPENFRVDVTAYQTAAGLANGTPSSLPSARLGGDPGDMVVVRVRYGPPDPRGFQRLLGGNTIDALAVACNEAGLED